MNYAVVHFMETNEVEVVPHSWIKKSGSDFKCCWPPYKSTSKIVDAVTKRQSVQETWKEYDARILGMYRTYGLAKSKVKKAEASSNLESEEEGAIEDTHQNEETASSSENDELEKHNTKRGKTKGITSKLIKNIPLPPVVSQAIGMLSLAEGSGCSLQVSLNNATPSKNPTSVSTPRLLFESTRERANEDNTWQDYALDDEVTGADMNTPISNRDKLEMFENEKDIWQMENDCSSNITKASCLKVDSRQPRRNNLRAGPEFSPFENFVINALGNLEHQMKAQAQMLLQISKTINRRNSETDDTTYNFAFPINSVDDLKTFEKTLEDKNKFEGLVQYLRHIGGSDYKECVANIFQRVLTDNLANHYCWEGIRKNNGKLPFKDLKIKDAIFKSVVATTTGNCCDATEHDMKKKAASWLQHAHDRIKSKAEKKKSKGDGIENL